MYCDQQVCACLSVCEDIAGITCAIFTTCFVHVAYGSRLVLLQQSDEIPKESDNFGGFLPH